MEDKKLEERLEDVEEAVSLAVKLHARLVRMMLHGGKAEAYACASMIRVWMEGLLDQALQEGNDGK